MRTEILSWLLHHANRTTKAHEFYSIKDKILSRLGKQVGYDIQHIEGKKCFTCNGTGQYPRWDQYGIYDPDWCWHCAGNGWYKDPQWIALARIQFGRYTFHKPLKREYSVKNPFTPESMGWEVTDRPVISGYIKHSETSFGDFALLVLYLIYNRKKFSEELREMSYNFIGSLRWKWRRFKQRFEKPKEYAQYQFDPDSDLPF
jgi:hypothetical protein